MKRPLQKKKQGVGTTIAGAIDSPESIRLEFKDARALQAVYGGDESLLRLMESTLGVHVTSRDGWLKIEGTSVAVAKARHLIVELQRVASLLRTVFLSDCCIFLLASIVIIIVASTSVDNYKLLLRTNA